MTQIPLTPAALFGLIVSNLIRSISVRCSSMPFIRPAEWGGGTMPVPLGIILHRRLNRAMARFTTLFTQAEARAMANGGLPCPAPPQPTSPKRERKPGNPQERLPGRFAWLTNRASEMAVHGTELHNLVTQPDVQPLIESDPRFGRVLRPIFQSLGVALPAWLKRPKRKRFYKPRPRKPREKGWSLDYEKSKESWTRAPESLPPWYFPKPSATRPVPPPVAPNPHPPPAEPVPYAVLIRRFIGHGQR